MAINEDFESFALAAWPKLIRGGRMLGLTTAEAEEAAQAALVNCYSRWRKVGRMAESPHAYTYSALVNQVRSRARRNREVLVAHLHDEAAPNDATEVPMLEAIKQLPLAQREVIVCRYYLDLSEEQTAETLGIARGTAKSRAHRALKTLRYALEEATVDGER